MEVIIYYIYTQEKHDEILHITQQKLRHLTQDDTVIIRCDEKCVYVYDHEVARIIFLPTSTEARCFRGQIVLVPQEMKDTMWYYEVVAPACNGLVYYYEEASLNLPVWLAEQNS